MVDKFDMAFVKKLETCLLTVLCIFWDFFPMFSVAVIMNTYSIALYWWTLTVLLSYSLDISLSNDNSIDNSIYLRLDLVLETFYTCIMKCLYDLFFLCEKITEWFLTLYIRVLFINSTCIMISLYIQFNWQGYSC